ncbi:hypothetical protein pb186bvf_015809 [Paramecium bursaria]
MRGIDRSRHANYQLAVSPDSPTNFQLKHVNIQPILFQPERDDNQRKILELKRIRQQGKQINMEQHQVKQRSNLSYFDSFNFDDQKRIPRKIKIYNTITNDSKEYDGEHRIATKNSRFAECYKTQGNFKRILGEFECFQNQKVRQNRQDHVVASVSCERNFSNRRTLRNTMRTAQSVELRKDPLNDSISYQNELNKRIASEFIMSKIRKIKLY